MSGLSGCASYCANQDTGDESMFSTPPAKGCKVYSPSTEPTRDVPFKLRAEKQTEDGISVSAVVLSDEESERVFGVNLAGNGIQPVWLEIENTTEKPVTLIYVATDPGYYSPNEAAYTNYSYASPVNEEMNEYFNKQSIKREIPAGGVLSGFFYTNWDPGVKYLNVSIYGEDQEKSFVFYFVIPGIKLDYQRVDWDSLYKKDEYVNYETEDELRKAQIGRASCRERVLRVQCRSRWSPYHSSRRRHTRFPFQ